MPTVETCRHLVPLTPTHGCLICSQSPTDHAAYMLLRANAVLVQAADALAVLGTPEARIHAAELRGAAKMTRRWELALRREATRGIA